MKTRKLLLTVAVLFIALFYGCANDDFQEVDGVCPLVTSTSPINGAINVPLDQIITVSFNEEMNPETINQSSFTLNGTSQVAGAVTYSGTTATFTPSALLTPNTTYSARITRTVKDLTGNALQTETIWTFSTGLTVTPMVSSTDPENNTNNVVLNKLVSVTFNMPMKASTINTTTYTLKQGTTAVSGTVSYSGNTALFTPTGPLAPNTVYTATVSKAATNLDNTALISDYVWKFTTGALVAPTVTATDPINNSTGVNLNKTITADFSMIMDPLTINGTNFTLKQGTTSIAGTVTYSGTRASFNPTNDLVEGEIYTATITIAAKSATGIPLANDYVWKFTTGALVAPTVTATNPINNSTGISLNQTVTADFSMTMDPLTINGTTFTLKQGTTTIAGTVTYSGTTASFNPTNDLLEGKIYTATITTGAKNVAGVPLANDYVWNFTTLVANTPAPTAKLFFGVFGGNAGITNQGLLTRINNGGIGTTAASTLVTGFTDIAASPFEVYTVTPLNNGLVAGGIYTAAPAPGNATKAQIALEGLNAARDLYNSISPASKPGGSDQGSGELGALSLAPGVYKSASGTYKITNGDLELDAQGDANAVWYFQAASSLTVGSPSASRSVKFKNGVGSPSNVYWYVGSTAVINYGGGGVMVGNIIANSGVTLSSPGNSTTPVGQETVLNGRAISLVSSVTMVNTIINIPNN
ncbi:Ig-like domain-containing protein [Flavobacterium sp. WC2416]|uniref:Ig-like domain-containing protein n=1 Tax=Flavobacterium sp. WC2416 TaxID=3234141 RepID=A0AB39W9E7_9FLAO